MPKARPVSNQDYWLDVNVKPLDITDKDGRVHDYVNRMLIDTASMLHFNGLPESVPERDLIRQLQTNGYAIFFKAKDGLIYSQWATLGGEPSPYYKPTEAIVSNPILGSYSLKIDKDCVLVRHDTYFQGLLPIMRKYATLLVENEISIQMAIIMSRIQSFISAQDSATRSSAEDVIRDLVSGKLSVVAEKPFLEGIKTSPYATAGHSNILSQLIEMEQYLKAGFWNTVGVNANYNMKREAINSNESQLNDDALIPIADDIIGCVKDGIDQVNAMFGTDITVELSGVWKDRQIIQEQQLEVNDMEVEGGSEDAAEQPEATDSEQRDDS